MELNTIYVLATAVALISCLLYPLRARSVPGFPTGSYLSKYTQPFIGSLFCVTYHFNRFHDMICDVAKEFGDGVTWTSGMIGSPPFIFIGADPNIVEHVLKRQFWKYEKGEFFRSTMSVFLGSGIFNSDGAQWQQQRKTASHLFTMRSLKEDMSQVFEKNALTILARFERYAKEKKVFDIQDLYFRFTLDSFSEIAFGESAGCLSDGAEVPFATSFDRVQLLTNMRFYAPRWVWKLKRALQVGSEREITRHIRVIRDYGFSVIENVKRHRGEDRALQQLHERADLLSRFIDYAETNGSPLPSNEELLDVVLNFIIAGRDTTACLLSWATYELTRHPELQEKLYEESLQSTVIDDGEATRAVKELPLLHAFIMETLRLHPPVPSDVKECVSQDVWPDGQVVPPGAMVIYSPYLMGRSTKLWGKNAAEFDLSRWFDPDTGLPIKEPSSYKFPVFNAGLRLCLGKNVAILESTMMLSLAVRQFRFHPTEASQQATYALSVTMPIKNGLKITVEKRQHAQATV